MALSEDEKKLVNKYCKSAFARTRLEKMDDIEQDLLRNAKDWAAKEVSKSKTLAQLAIEAPDVEIFVPTQPL